MFGHDDDQSPQQQPGTASDKPASAAVDTTDNEHNQPDGPAAAESNSAADQPDAIAPTDTSGPAATPSLTPTDSSQPWQHPGTPATNSAPSNDNNNGQDKASDVISPAGGFPHRPSFQYASAGLADADDPAPVIDATDAETRELVGIKQKALSELSPLIDQLDMPPEEKFRTIIMMIQASDDETLVKAAYAAAHSIKDEKTRAQALLDIINEVNYFTQQPAV